MGIYRQQRHGTCHQRHALNNKTHAALRGATPTLYHRSTDTTSTTDLNLVSADIVNKTQYTVLGDIGSDYRPTLIQVTYNMVAPHRPRRWRWNNKKANWVRYRDLTDARLQSLQFGKDVNKNCGRICEVITNAAKQSIPRHRRRYKPYWTAELAEFV